MVYRECVGVILGSIGLAKITGPVLGGPVLEEYSTLGSILPVCSEGLGFRVSGYRGTLNLMYSNCWYISFLCEGVLDYCLLLWISVEA